MKCYEMITAPIFHLPVSLVRMEGKDSGVQLILGRMGWGEGGFSFAFISYCPTLLLAGSTLN